MTEVSSSFGNFHIMKIFFVQILEKASPDFGICDFKKCRNFGCRRGRDMKLALFDAAENSALNEPY